MAMHEMLHFLFFDLVEKLFPNININTQKMWEISEVFNGLIMQESEFVEITGVRDPGQYPDLIKLQKGFEAVWKKRKKANEFLAITLS